MTQSRKRPLAGATEQGARTDLTYLLVCVLALTACGGDSAGPVQPPPGPVCEGTLCNRSALDALGLAAFYQKYLDAEGIPVIGSEKVDDAALVMAAEIVVQMLAHRADVHAAMEARGAYVGIMAHDEVTTDIPEHAYLANDSNTDWNQRARGLGGTPNNPITTAGEENLLCLAGDRYAGESILVHEFAHAVHLIGIDAVDPTIHQTLEQMLQEALVQGLWADTYAGSNRQEYWAEGVQSWFDNNQAPQQGIHNDVDTRAELRAYDPPLAALLEQYLGDGSWRPGCPAA